MNKQGQSGKDPMKDFFKEICKDMKEENERIKQASSIITTRLIDGQILYDIDSKHNGKGKENEM